MRKLLKINESVDKSAECRQFVQKVLCGRCVASLLWLGGTATCLFG